MAWPAFASYGTVLMLTVLNWPAHLQLYISHAMLMTSSRHRMTYPGPCGRRLHGHVMQKTPLRHTGCPQQCPYPEGAANALVSVRFTLWFRRSAGFGAVAEDKQQSDLLTDRPQMAT